MNTLYVGIISGIVLFLLVAGSGIVYGMRDTPSVLTGILMLIVGVLLILRYRVPKPSPSKIWVMAFLGQKIPYVARYITVSLPPFVREVEISLELKTHDFKAKTDIVCHGGGYIKKEDLIVGTAFRADTQDDPPGRRNWRSGPQKMIDYDDAGKADQIIKIIDEFPTAIVEEFAQRKGHTAKWMEKHPKQIAAFIAKRLEGLRLRRNGTAILVHPDEEESDDIRGLGIVFVKIVVNIQRPKDVVAAAIKVQIEAEERESDLLDDATLNKLIVQQRNAWIEFHGKGAKVPPYEYFEREAIKRRAIREGKYQVFAGKGAVPWVAANTGQGKPAGPGKGNQSPPPEPPEADDED